MQLTVFFCAFLIISNLTVAALMRKNKNGENWILPSSRKYAIQLRVERLFGLIHSRDDKPNEFWENFWLKSKGRKVKT